MSLLSAENCIAVLGAHRVLLAVRQGGQLRALGSAECSSREPSDWAEPVETLQRLLAGRPRRRGTLSVVLGGHFLRFCLVPWSDALGTPAELQAFARLQFEEIYGSEATDWRLQLSPQAAGAPRLAAALPAELYERLQALAGAAGLRLVALQPYLMAAFNRLCQPLAGGDFLFLLAEPERSCLLVARDGRWVAVRAQAGNDSDAALALLLERESELQALEAQPPAAIYLHAPGRSELAALSVRGLPARVLGSATAAPGGTAADALWTMAMTVN